MALVAAVGALAHLATITRYGIFRDELYYVACGRHLAWGYVDHPPLVGVLGWFATQVLGGSIVALRLVPILCGVLTVYVTASLVRRLGGGTWAQVAAGACVTIAPHYLFTFHILSMNAPEILLWTLAARLLIEAVESPRRSIWLALGAVVGIGALNKHSMLFWAIGLLAGVLATPYRRVLASRGPWIGISVAAALFLPHVVWQIRNDWPVIEFVRNAQEHKIVALTPVQFLAEQFGMMHVLAAPVWVAGLVFCFLRARGRSPSPAGIFGWAWLVVLAIFLLQRSKAYYLTPAYPPLLAAGAVVIEHWRGRVAHAVHIAALPVWAAGGIALAPLVLPILAPEQFVRYQAALGRTPSSGERHEMGDLPQHFADMHGWEDMARAVSAAYQALPPAERAGARFYGQNYGEAGAVDYYRRRYPLPPAISGHNAYWTWGPGGEPVGTVLILGGDRADHESVFRRVEAAGRHDAAHAMPYERNLTIWLCREIQVPLADAWAGSRHYN